ncbi:MAG: lyase family protein [Acidilobaceae archaeon]|nr:lyase family protein [Acidilobaceae archaeon]
MYRHPLLGPYSERVLKYTSSLEPDKKIACEVLEVLAAHVEELRASGLIPESAAEDILRELRGLMGDPAPLFGYPAEDVHEAIELFLKERLGERAGYLALGRSRNDHVAAALRLKASRLLLSQLAAVAELREALLKRAEEWAEVLVPSYTHFRPAQVSTLGHYVASIDEALSLYSGLLLKALEVALKSPLGAGASAGTSAPISRERLAARLFLGGLVKNALYASGSRDFLAAALSINASLAVLLSRVAEDLILFSSPHFGYFSLPPEHLATSSIMPHKKNPVSLEIARANAGEALGALVTVLTIAKGVPSGYSLDLQQSNSHAIYALERTLETLLVLKDLFERLEAHRDAMLKDVREYPIMAPDLAELIAMMTRRPFREVHAELAQMARGRSAREIYEEVERKYGVKAEEGRVVRRPVKGSSSPEEVRKYIAEAREELRSLLPYLKELSEKLAPSCPPPS